MNWCSCRLFVLCIRVDSYIPTLYQHYEGTFVVHFLVQRTHPAVLLYTSRRYFATAFPSSPPSSSSLSHFDGHVRCGWSYNLSAAIGNFLIKFRIADKTREMDCTGVRRDTAKRIFPLDINRTTNFRSP